MTTATTTKANKKVWLAALLNFFFMGAGTLYLGHRKALGLALTLGAIALTYVEMSLKPISMDLYTTMFGAVFLVNTFLAVDAAQEARAINAGLPVRRSTCDGGIIVQNGARLS